MTFWIVAAAVCVVLLAIAWWTSGRSKRRAFDPHRSMIQSDAYRHSHETNARFDQHNPFNP